MGMGRGKEEMKPILEAIKVMDERAEEGWDKEALINIARVHGVSKDDVMMNGSAYLLGVLGLRLDKTLRKKYTEPNKNGDAFAVDDLKKMWNRLSSDMLKDISKKYISTSTPKSKSNYIKGICEDKYNGEIFTQKYMKKENISKIANFDKYIDNLEWDK